MLSTVLQLKVVTNVIVKREIIQQTLKLMFNKTQTLLEV